MMEFDIVTIFPDAVKAFLNEGLLQKAQAEHFVDVRLHDLRDHTHDRHRTVDDAPYGGGAGMVMKPEPFFEAVDRIREDDWKGQSGAVILLDPQGEKFSQAIAVELSQLPRMALLCGRYEGVDERVKERLADRLISIGDYVLMGGELPALVVLEAAARLIPGFLNPDSTVQESFASPGHENGNGHSFHGEDRSGSGLLEYPQYTRPVEYRGYRVPEILLSGNHPEIAKWRRKEMLKKTLKQRPDLLDREPITEEDRQLLKMLREEEHHG